VSATEAVNASLIISRDQPKDTNGHILNANLSKTLKKSNLNDTIKLLQKK